MLSQSQRKLTAKELAAKLGCSVSTVYRLKLAGRLAFHISYYCQVSLAEMLHMIDINI